MKRCRITTDNSTSMRRKTDTSMRRNKLFSSTISCLNAYKTKQEMISGAAGLQACGIEGVAKPILHPALGKLFSKLWKRCGRGWHFPNELEGSAQGWENIRKYIYLFIFFPDFWVVSWKNPHKIHSGNFSERLIDAANNQNPNPVTTSNAKKCKRFWSLGACAHSEKDEEYPPYLA